MPGFIHIIKRFKVIAHDLLAQCIALGNSIIWKREQVILHASPDVEDQTISILRYFLKSSNWTAPIILVVSADIGATRSQLRQLLGSTTDRVQLVGKHSLLGVWAYWRSKYVFITHGLYLSSLLPPQQIVINMWHGMPIKAVWKANNRQEFTAVQACTYMLCTSQSYAHIMHSLTGLPKEVFKNIGLPRNDLLFSSTIKVRAFRANGLVGGFSQLAICMPTFRQTKGQHKNQDGCEGENALMVSASELSRLQSVLAEARIKLLVKPHPMSIHHGEELLLTPNIQIISDQWLHAQGVTLYEALGQTDFLITDVSSVYIDYLCLNRPVFIYFPDLASYRTTRGFLFEPVENWMPGKLCTTMDQLLSELADHAAGRDPHRETRMRLAAELNPQEGPIATNRLMALLGLPVADANDTSQ